MYSENITLHEQLSSQHENINQEYESISPNNEHTSASRSTHVSMFEGSNGARRDQSIDELIGETTENSTSSSNEVCFVPKISYPVHYTKKWRNFTCFFSEMCDK